jgi:hypothetical protein
MTTRAVLGGWVGRLYERERQKNAAQRHPPPVALLLRAHRQGRAAPGAGPVCLLWASVLKYATISMRPLRGTGNGA